MAAEFRYGLQPREWNDAATQSAFISNGYTSGVGAQLARNRQGSVYAGHRDSFRFSEDAGAGSWMFAASGAYPLLCGSIRDLATFTPLKGFLYQNPDESNYGVPLRSGEYRKIMATVEHETCVYVVQGGLDAVGNNIYTSRVTGALAKLVPGQANTALSDLKTDYAVLAYEFAQYDRKFRSCERTHADACAKQFAASSEQEFALFERRISSNNFPARVSGQVDKLEATARKLTRLFEQLAAGAPTVATITKISAGKATLSRQYKTLVHALS